MHRSTLASVPLSIVLLAQNCFQARASPVPPNLHPLKDSPSGCLTVIFFLALSLTILFIFKKIYVARRRKIDPVSIPSSNGKAGRSMNKVKKSGFYVGLLGSPDWETKRSLFIGGGPGCISFPPKSRTPSRRRVSTSILHHKVPARCEITSARPVPNNTSGHELQPLHIVVSSPEISRPLPAVVHPGPFSDIEPSFCTRRSTSPLMTRDYQSGDFQSNENITLNAGSGNLVLFSSLNSEYERHFSGTYDPDTADIVLPTQAFRTLTKHAPLCADLLENSIQQSTIKALHFDPIPKRRARAISQNPHQLYSHDVNYLTAALAASPLMVPDSLKSCRQFDPSSNSVRLKPQCSSPTKRTRTSPIIGPSPLRTMSLPSDYGLQHTEKLNVNNCSMLSKIRLEDQFEPSLDSSPSSSHPPSIPKRSKMVLQADDPDIILDLIRELAQETSAWDASLFLDENFKTMIDQSKIYPSCKPKPQIAQEKRTRSKHSRKQRCMTPFIPLQDIPEFDVLIAISEENVNPNELFWDDEIDPAYQHDAQLQSLSLGVTH